MESRSSWLRAAGACGVAAALIALQASVAAHPPPSAAKVTPEEAARRAVIVLRHEHGQISTGELEDAIQARNPLMQERYRNTSAVQAVLDGLLRSQLQAAEAERRGYGKHPDVVLAQKQNAVQELLQHDFDEKFTVRSVPAEDVKKHYDEHLAEFVRGEGRRVSWLRTPDEATAKALLPEAKATDMRAFRELVRNKSTDETTKQRGGDLRYFDVSGRSFDADDHYVDPVIVKVAFALNHVGDTSDVVQTADGFGIVKLSGIRDAENHTLAEAEERVRSRLWREKRQAAIDATLEELKKQLKVVVHPELIDAVKLDQGPPLPPAPGLPRGFPHTRPGLPIDTSKAVERPAAQTQ